MVCLPPTKMSASQEDKNICFPHYCVSVTWNSAQATVGDSAQATVGDIFNKWILVFEV